MGGMVLVLLLLQAGLHSVQLLLGCVDCGGECFDEELLVFDVIAVMDDGGF